MKFKVGEANSGPVVVIPKGYESRFLMKAPLAFLRHAWGLPDLQVRRREYKACYSIQTTYQFVVKYRRKKTEVWYNTDIMVTHVDTGNWLEKTSVIARVPEGKWDDDELRQIAVYFRDIIRKAGKEYMAFGLDDEMTGE